MSSDRSTSLWRISIRVFLVLAVAGTANASCIGDCNRDNEVTIEELVLAVNIGLETASLDACNAADSDGNGEVTIDEIITAVDAALSVCISPIVFGGENNRLNAYDPSDNFRKQTVIRSHNDDPEHGRDINGQICFFPDGSRRFIAGEDTGQPNPPQGWGIFQLMGERVGELSATQVGKLTPTYQGSLDNAENYGCGFLSDGRLLTSDVGNQAAGDGDGQLIVWFPPFDAGTNPHYCKIDTTIATAGGIFVDEQDRIYVASARTTPGIYRYSGPFPTSDDTAGGCGRMDGTGAPLADSVDKQRFINADSNVRTPNAIVRSPQGTFYVSSVLNGVIGEYNAEGRFMRRVLTPVTGQGLPFPATGTPLGLGIDGKGTIYYADIGITQDGLDIGPGPNLGHVRRIRFVGGQPQAPETMDSGLNFPDGIGTLQ